MRTRNQDTLVGKLCKIHSDGMNVTVMRRMANNQGKEYWTPIAYFASMNHALKYIVDREIKLIGFEDFRKVVAKQEELYTLINQLQLS